MQLFPMSQSATPKPNQKFIFKGLPRKYSAEKSEKNQKDALISPSISKYTVDANRSKTPEKSLTRSIFSQEPKKKLKFMKHNPARFCKAVEKGASSKVVLPSVEYDLELIRTINQKNDLVTFIETLSVIQQNLKYGKSKVAKRVRFK